MTSLTPLADAGVSVDPDLNAPAFAQRAVTNEADSTRWPAAHYSCEACHRE